MYNILEPYVLDKYKIPQINLKNPFYIQVSLKLPTLLINKIKRDFYIKYNRKQLCFMKDISIATN